MPATIQEQDFSTIAFLATGDELTSGDILNTNGQVIASELKSLGFTIGHHIIANDAELDIVDSLKFLCARYRIIIITGGLGPTSDDKTRFALATLTTLPLDFHEASWQQIVNRLQQFKLKAHESNRQQALFPRGAEVLINNNGTANGCFLDWQNKWLFMLPGPPRECLPIFREQIVPKLLPFIPTEHFFLQYRLFGVSEGEIAAQLDETLANLPVITGYRWDYPYLECKIRGHNNDIKHKVTQLAEQLLLPYCICTIEKTASQLCADFLAKQQITIIINDNATGGLLLAKLVSPKTYALINTQTEANISLSVSGLKEYWQGLSPTGQAELVIDIKSKQKQLQLNKVLPFRHEGIQLFAVEWIAHQLLLFMK